MMKYGNCLALVTLMLLVGCTRSLMMETTSDVPAPLVAQLPLTVGVYYDVKFRTYVYEENSEDRPNWAIRSGAAEVELFDRILSSMFEDTQQVSSLSVATGSGHTCGITSSGDVECWGYNSDGQASPPGGQFKWADS